MGVKVCEGEDVWGWRCVGVEVCGGWGGPPNSGHHWDLPICPL